MQILAPNRHSIKGSTPSECPHAGKVAEVFARLKMTANQVLRNLSVCALFALSLRNGISVRSLVQGKCGPSTVSTNHYHTRQAAAALLKMAKTTSDPGVAARLIEAAADLKDQAGELPLPIDAKPPDVQMEE